jgi:enoyl-CoA hydratase/carnithine racemase
MKAASPGGILITDEGPLRRCLIDRPERRNALSLALCSALQSAIESCDSSTRLLVIDHTGEVFCSGADLKEVAPALFAKENLPSAGSTLEAIRGLFAAIELSPTPIVAFIDGRCVAGGLELALACDLIASTARSHFSDGHLATDLLPSGGAPVRLLERLGPGRTFRLLVEGVELDANDAREWGLVDVLAEDRLAFERWLNLLSNRLGGYPTDLVRRAKEQLAAGRYRRDGPRFRLELDELDGYIKTSGNRVRERLQRHLKS